MMNLTIVVPCYNEEEVLPETARRLLQLVADLQAAGSIDPSSEILLIDDGSNDRTWSLIQGLVRGAPAIHGLKLSRNRGHQNALLAGLMNAQGDAVISIDADLQDDISVMAKMVDAYHAGYDIVYGVRENRDVDTAFKRLTAEGYYGLMRILGVELVFNHADYRLMSRRAIEALRHYGEVNLFLRGIIPLLGFRSTQVYYRRLERLAGESKYPLHKMLGLAVNGITSFSAVPLRMITVLGLIVFAVSTMFGIWALSVRLFSDEAVPGWASTVIPTYFLGGIQLLSVGIIGEYLAKIYMEVKRRPPFHIEERN
jgi:glycosyltransferase involved in cell wall biosynthesis